MQDLYTVYWSVCQNERNLHKCVFFLFHGKSADVIKTKHKLKETDTLCLLWVELLLEFGTVCEHL